MVACRDWGLGCVVGDMTIEIKQIKFGLGIERRDWPKTRHYICRVGFVEARAICSGESSMLVVACFLIAGIVAGFHGQWTAEAI